MLILLLTSCGVQPAQGPPKEEAVIQVKALPEVQSAIPDDLGVDADFPVLLMGEAQRGEEITLLSTDFQQLDGDPQGQWGESRAEYWGIEACLSH